MLLVLVAVRASAVAVLRCLLLAGAPSGMVPHMKPCMTAVVLSPRQDTRWGVDEEDTSEVGRRSLVFQLPLLQIRLEFSSEFEMSRWRAAILRASHGVCGSASGIDHPAGVPTGTGDELYTVPLL